jgi:hypothetical protein
VDTLINDALIAVLAVLLTLLIWFGKLRTPAQPRKPKPADPPRANGP